MSMVNRLMAQLEKRGIEVVYVSDTELRLKGNTKAADQKLMEALKIFKGELVEHLRPRDMTLKRYDVHHEPPVCSECKSHVWDKEETGMICESMTCPMKKR